MTEWLDKSEFYHFGILPQVCIHSPVEDQYSNMYVPERSCKCGCEEWIDGTMDIVKPIDGYQFPKNSVHRCKDCLEVRLANHIGIKNETN